MKGYAAAVFEWLSRKDRFVLLSGPSIGSLSGEMPRLATARPALIGLNHIFNVERNILAPFNLSFDVWVIFAHDEVERHIQAILDFIARPTSVAVLTSSFALGRVRDVLELRAVPNLHKLVLCDPVIEAAYRITSIEFTNTFNYNSATAVNSLGLLLMTLAVTPVASGTATYLFGCDGAASGETAGVYYDEANMDLGRRVLAERNIYQDMIAFDAAWPNLLENFVRRLQPADFPVLNVNPESLYQSFPKAALADLAPSGAPEAFVSPPEASDVGVREEFARRFGLMGSSLTCTMARSEAMLARLISGRDSPTEQAALAGLSGEADERLAAALARAQVLAVRLEEVRGELIARTRLLEEANGALVERTEALDQVMRDTVERDRELTELRELLADRTARLEAATDEAARLKQMTPRP